MNNLPSTQPKNDLALTQTQSVTLADKVRDCLSAYGSASDFGSTFSVSKLQTYVHYPSRCICGTAPTLMTTAEAYGLTPTIQWLMTLFIGISEFSGAKEKITPYQLEKLAHKFYDRAKDLKVTEVMLFIDKMESGDFGRFSWHSFDPVAVLDKIDAYRSYARRIVEREESIIAEKRAEEDRKRAVPCPPHILEHLQKFAQGLSSSRKDDESSWLSKLATPHHANS